MKDIGVLLIVLPLAVFFFFRFILPGYQWRAAGLALGLVIAPACASVWGISWRISPRLGSLVERIEHLHRQVAPGSAEATSLVWGAVYGLGGYAMDRLLRRRSQGPELRKTIIIISRDEVLAKDTRLVRAAVKGRCSELRELFSSMDSQGHSEKQLRLLGERAKCLTNMVLTIHGYDEDSGPLWRYPGGDNKPELREWAWHLLQEMPYAVAFLELQSALLMGLLCLGGLVDTDYNGFIPDFQTDREKADMFMSLLRNATTCFMSNHKELPDAVYVLITMNMSSILDPFEEMKKHLG